MTTRVTGWQARLKLVIEKHIPLASEYGVSDCYIIADDAVEAVTGERMFPDIIGNYSTAQGATKLLLARGFSNVEEAFASKFEVVPTSLAQRGDIGVIENNGEICGGFFTALGFVARDPARLIFLPIVRVKTAFKVGR